MPQESSQNQRAHYMLYHNPFSICSIMVRFTIALAKLPHSLDDTIIIEETITDIYREEQLSEAFLLRVNPKGQVPALTSSSLPVPLTDSLDITYYLCDVYSHLTPQPHCNTIVQLLQQLHQIQYLSLSFNPQQQRAKGISIAIEKLLERSDISKEYRQALEYKADYHERTLVHALEKEAIIKAEQQASDFFQEILNLRLKYGQGSLWIYGDAVGPTALDAHTVVFIARLFDAKREDLMTGDIREYGQHVMAESAWKGIMNGRPTLYSLWVEGAWKSQVSPY